MTCVHPFARRSKISRLVLGGLLGSLAASSLMSQVVDLHGRLELFADDFVIESLSGDAQKVLQKPEPKEVVFTTDAAWEGNLSGAYSIFQDGEGYRMYYRGSAADTTMRELSHPEVTCMAESKDGIHWTRPILNLHEWEGSKENNIVWREDAPTHNMAVFKDENPQAAADARYKAIVQTETPRANRSADGIHWTPVTERLLPTEGPLDSQNVAFWDPVRAEYRLYWIMSPLAGRMIQTATSKDFVQWEKSADLVYPGKPVSTNWKDAFHLSTATILPYFRAPQLMIGFPAQLIFPGPPYPFAQGVSQPLLMTSRDGVEFSRWDEPVIPPTAPENRDGNRSNVMAWGMLQLPNAPNEISLYATENYFNAGPTRLRRFVYRLDGFVSISSGAAGGELLTKPFRSVGKELVINYKVHGEGTVRVEIQDESGKALEGFSLEDCDPLTGDEVAAVVHWKGNSDLGASLSQPVRVRFVFKNADLYSFKL